MKTLRKSLPLLLLAVREQVREQFQPTFREFNITEQQWRILRLLYEDGDLFITEIADQCCIFRPSIVGILNRMEELSLIRRKDCVDDRRRTKIRLAPKGKAIVEKIFPIFSDIYDQLDTGVGKAKLEQLYSILNEVNARLTTYNAENTAAPKK